THYSLLTAPNSPRELCEEAARRGHDHLVLADSNGLYGLWPFAQEAARARLRAVFGCELVHRGRRVVAIARDDVGYGSLCELISARQLDADFDLPRAAARHAAGLWFVCGDLALLPELAVRLPRAQLLVALGPDGEPATDADDADDANGAEDGGGIGRKAPERDAGIGRKAPERDAGIGRKAPDPGRQWPRRQRIEAAETLGLDLVAVRDVWFAREDDHGLHAFFLAVKWNRALPPGASGDDVADCLRGHRPAERTAQLPAHEGRQAPTCHGVP